MLAKTKKEKTMKKKKVYRIKTDYEMDVDQFIPVAMAKAKAVVDQLPMPKQRMPGVGESFYNHCFVTEHFHKFMKELTIENEIRRF